MPLTKLPKRRKSKKPSTPVWKGPEEDGITFSLLSRWLCCRERFRLLVVEGLRPADTFNHRLEYGQMWHLCEQCLANNQPWEPSLKEYAQELCRRYRESQEQIQHWYNVCKMQFPIYVDYWSKHKDVKQRTPLLQEQVFDVPYQLPSGRTVRLRGKWDSVDLIGKGKNAGIYLFETKTKGDINEQQLKQQLQFDLQVMLYAVALQEHISRGIRGIHATMWNGQECKGVRYNVVRRPLSGGKHSIRQHKATKSKPAEASEAFYARLSQLIEEDAGHFFMRWKVEITPQDIERFKREFLNPVLEQLCEWWSWVSRPTCKDGTDHWDHEGGLHFRSPYGAYNPLLEGGSSDLDEYLSSGSMVGLERTDNLFRELS